MTDPSHTHRPAHTMGAHHPRTLFSVLATPDSQPTVGILALQGNVRGYSLTLEAVGARPVVVRRVTDPGEAPSHRLSGLVIPGGEPATMSALLVVFGIFVPLHESIGAGLSAYGSRAGMIILTDHVEGIQEGQASLGGIDMTVRHNTFGWQMDFYEKDLIAPEPGAGPDRPLRAAFIRAPWVEEVGPGVEILATTHAGCVAGVGGADDGRTVAIRRGSLLATSLYPGVGGDHRVHDALVSMVTCRA